MTRDDVDGVVTRQDRRLRIEVPDHVGYLYRDDLADLIAGALGPDVEVLDWRGGDLGRCYLSCTDDRRVTIGFRGYAGGPITERYLLFMTHAQGLLRGQRWRAPLRAVYGHETTAPATGNAGPLHV